MHGLLIVDDDYFTRLGIEEAINWSDYEITCLGSAENGQIGLEMARNLKPDLIISDVRMPALDGVEFAKTIKKELDCEIVMLSGYGDYPYVKECFENGVFSYLMKPIENDKLLETVLQARDRIVSRRNEKNYISSLKDEIENLKGHFLKNVIDGETVSDIDKKLSLYNIDIIGKSIMLVHFDQNERRDHTLDLINESLNAKSLKYEYEAVGEDYLYIFESVVSKEELDKCLINATDEYEKCGCTLSIAITNPIKDNDDFIESLRKLKSLNEVKLFPMISSINYTDGAYKKYKPIIIQAMNYIAQHYSEKINAKMVAEELYVSPSNLMHAFKDELGKTFNDCLTNYRIIMAKKFLRDGKYKIYEVSDMVGHSDVRYFSQIFKQVTGLKPTEYGVEQRSSKSDD